MSRCLKVRATTDKSSRDASVPTIMLQVISQHDRYLACVEEGAFLARGSEAAVGSVWNWVCLRMGGMQPLDDKTRDLGYPHEQQQIECWKQKITEKMAQRNAN